jgi:hypothetical protein
MSKEIIDFTERQLREVFTKIGLNSQDVERAIADYMRYRERELSSFNLLTYKELKTLEIKDVHKIVMSLRDGADLLEGIIRDYLRYLNYKKRIAETYQESKSWDKVITTDVYSDIPEAQEGFIDYVEETYQTKIKDGKHLQKLTGITEDTLEGLEETLLNSRKNKYERALETALQEGAKYKALLQIKPQDYGLPKTWSGYGGSDQYSSILWAIMVTFRIGEDISVGPDLKTIAQEIEAPYSVLLDAHKIGNKWKLQG